jgi:hypothetical protein
MAMGKTFEEQEDDMDEFAAEADGAEPEVEAEAEAEAPAEASPAASRDESPEERTVASRQKQREQMAKEIEEFLARGGKINQIDANVSADPPRKPDSDYGSRPI